MQLSSFTVLSDREVQHIHDVTVDILETITATDFEDLWLPERFKGHVSDDISAGFEPDIYAEFSAPYHARVFKIFGVGGLHNCGPVV